MERKSSSKAWMMTFFVISFMLTSLIGSAEYGYGYSYSVSRDVKATTPILIKGFFVGGLVDGKWKAYDAFYESKAVELESYEYDVYKNGKKTGMAKGQRPINPKSGEILSGDKYQEEFSCIDLFDANQKKVDYDIAIKGDWDLFPRKYRNQSIDQKVYKDIVKNVLKAEGIVNPNIKPKQILRVDLEGDGVEEVLIAANNLGKNGFETTKKGDGALIIFRKVVNGKVKQQVLTKDIIKKKPEYESIFRYSFDIGPIADLDGDGIMEVVIRNWYYEGEEWSIYKLKNNRLEFVTGNGWGA